MFERYVQEGQVMNRLLCFLTGGHKLTHEGIWSQTLPDGSGVEIMHPCEKCGKTFAFIMSYDFIMKGGEE